MSSSINNMGAYRKLSERLQSVYPSDYKIITSHIDEYFSIQFKGNAPKTISTALGSINRFLYWCEQNRTDFSCIEEKKFLLYKNNIIAKRKNFKPEIRIVTQVSRHILQKMNMDANRKSAAQALMLLGEAVKLPQSPSTLL